MRLCDQDPSSTIRAVCFDETMFESFEVMKTYEMECYKVKKGFGYENDIEVLIDSDTKVKESVTQFKMERYNFTVGQIVRGATENIRFVHLKGKVLSIEDIVTVGRYPDQKEKREIVLADKTGEISLVLWRDRAKEIVFKKGDVLKIENAVVGSFNKRLYMTTSMETSLEVVQHIFQRCELTINSPTEEEILLLLNSKFSLLLDLDAKKIEHATIIAENCEEDENDTVEDQENIDSSDHDENSMELQDKSIKKFKAD
ncbi:hypothetical protein QZH41_002962 [Actinostola sp. cb2023]|nr:hypothetical protein QZH41_002962 [Actinostola sp. cb2023]